MWKNVNMKLYFLYIIIAMMYCSSPLKMYSSSVVRNNTIYGNSTYGLLYKNTSFDSVNVIDTITYDEDEITRTITTERILFGYKKYDNFITVSAGLPVTAISGIEFGVNFFYSGMVPKPNSAGFFGSIYYTSVAEDTDTIIKIKGYYDLFGKYHAPRQEIKTLNNDFNITSFIGGLCVVPQISERMFLVIRFGPGIYISNNPKQKNSSHDFPGIGMLSVTASYFFTQQISVDFTAKYYYYHQFDHFFLPNISLTYSL